MKNDDVFGYALLETVKYFMLAILVAEFVPSFMDAAKSNAEFDAHPIRSIFSFLLPLLVIGICSCANQPQKENQNG